MIELVKAKDADKEFLLQLRKSTMTEHLEKAGLFLSDEQHLQRILFHFENSYIIVMSDRKEGFLKYIETVENIEILQLQVLPEQQGKGIGREVLDFLTVKAKNEMKNLTLKVLKENPAKKLYERNGFKVVGEDTHEFYMRLYQF